MIWGIIVAIIIFLFFLADSTDNQNLMETALGIEHGENPKEKTNIFSTLAWSGVIIAVALLFI